MSIRSGVWLPVDVCLIVTFDTIGAPISALDQIKSCVIWWDSSDINWEHVVKNSELISFVPGVFFCQNEEMPVGQWSVSVPGERLRVFSWNNDQSGRFIISDAFVGLQRLPALSCVRIIEGFIFCWLKTGFLILWCNSCCFVLTWIKIFKWIQAGTGKYRQEFANCNPVEVKLNHNNNLGYLATMRVQFVSHIFTMLFCHL